MAVHLTCIEVDGVRLGIYPDERRIVQPVVVDVRLQVDVSRVVQGDNIAHTADYAAIIALVAQICRARHYELLETLVMAVTRGLLDAFATVHEADVSICKTRAPVTAQVSARWRLCRRVRAAAEGRVKTF